MNDDDKTKAELVAELKSLRRQILRLEEDKAHSRPNGALSLQSEETYRAILAEHGSAPSRFLMVGNSLRSDVLPVVAIGGQAVHIPHHWTWAHEEVPETDSARLAYVELARIGLLPSWLQEADLDTSPGTRAPT